MKRNSTPEQTPVTTRRKSPEAKWWKSRQAELVGSIALGVGAMVLGVAGGQAAMEAQSLHEIAEDKADDLRYQPSDFDQQTDTQSRQLGLSAYNHEHAVSEKVIKASGFGVGMISAAVGSIILSIRRNYPDTQPQSAPVPTPPVA